MMAVCGLTTEIRSSEWKVIEGLVTVPETASKQSKKSIRDQILAVVDRMPKEMQIKLLKFLQTRLPRRIRGNLVVEKRGDFRRDCLVSLEYRIDERTFEGFILDISAFGVFIESDQPFPVDKLVHLSFSLPGYPEQLNLVGKIVWSGSQGFGVKFDALARGQMRMIRTFSEQQASVYTIVS